MSRVRKYQKRSKAKRVIAVSLITALMCVCGYKIYDILHEYSKADNTYKKVEEKVMPDPKKEEGPDFSTLPPYVTHWLVYEGLGINYPVVQSASSSEDDFWLHHMYNKEYNFAGTLFFPSWADSEDQNRVIYGHAMNNGAMFGNLKKMKDQQFANANQKFTLYSRTGKKEIYRVFAVYETRDMSNTYDGNFEHFNKWKESCWNQSVVTTEKAGAGHVITLSTCNNRSFYGRMVVQGVLEGSGPY